MRRFSQFKTWLKKLTQDKFEFRMILAISFCLIVILLKTYTHHIAAKRALALPVVLAEAKTMDVPIYLDALGTVTPTYSITVKSQIDGYLLRVMFTEGQMVKTGDLLAQIDPQPYLAQLMQYEGQLLHDQALLDNANIDLKRYQTLWKQDSISQQTLATQEALVKEYQGQIQIDQGLIEGTKVNLEYCAITAPTNGRVGLRLVDPGNYVQTSDTTGIAIINTVDPITVIFVLAEDDIPAVMERMQNDTPIVIQAYDRQQKHLISTGTLLTIDNQIDTATGTVKLRAQFENSKNQLFANQFVNARLFLETVHNATVIPKAAIRFKAKDKYVYVKNKDLTVRAQPVTLGHSIEDQVTITKGISPGDWVVVEGGDKLVDGVAIRPVEDTTQNTG